MKEIQIPSAQVDVINAYLRKPDSRVMQGLHEVVARYGSPEEINARARQAREPAAIIKRLREIKPQYVEDLSWLEEQRQQGAFVSAGDYCQSVPGHLPEGQEKGYPVVLEISALQYFPWLMEEARQAIQQKELMPARFIRVRNMKEQEQDGDLLAVTAAMQILGASCVETLDTRGTDGSNIHLGGPETIFGYLGGVGQPNEHALKWIDEFLYYYTKYGVQEVLNINPGTVLLANMLYQMGVDIRYKVSVFMGNDNPYSVLSVLQTAMFYARDDGSIPLVGLNLANSADNGTLALAAEAREAFGLTGAVRLEHHILEPGDIVRHPYNRRNELIEIAQAVPNISAKHEAGDPDVEEERNHPSRIGDYFRSKQEIIESGEMDALRQNYLDKHTAVNGTARQLTENGIPFVAAPNLHHHV